MAELEALRVAFLSHSKGERNTVDIHEFQAVLEAVDIHLPHLERVFKLFDTNNDGRIDFRELVCGVGRVPPPRPRSRGASGRARLGWRTLPDVGF